MASSTCGERRLEQCLPDTGTAGSPRPSRCRGCRTELGAFVELNARFWSSNTTAWIDAIAAATVRPIDKSTLEPVTLALYRLGQELSATQLFDAMS
jgi:hypothetical protein